MYSTVCSFFFFFFHSFFSFLLSMNIMSSTIVTHLIITYHPDCKSMFIFSFNLMYSDALIKSFIHTHFISLWDCSLSFDLNIDCFVVHSYHVALHSSDFFVILTSFRRLYHNNVVFALYNQQCNASISTC